ncbi:MAG: hypothetical protein IKN04_04120 [Clostridia bacterium]|nr:hypothetical protein [Clostridia bacterium]
MSNIDRFSASKLQSAADQKKKKDNQQSGGSGGVSASRFDAGYMQRAADYQKEQERIRQSMITAAQTGTPFSADRALQMSRQGGLWTGVSNAMEKQFGAELNNPADRVDAVPSKGTLLRQYDKELDTKIAAQDEQIKALQNQWAQTSTSYAGRRDGREDDLYRAQREEAMKAQNEAKATKEYLLSRKALIGENLIVFEAAENGDLDLFEDYYKEHVTNQANRGTTVLGQNNGDSWLGSLPAEVAYAQSSVRENTAKNELKKRGYTDEQILHYINARNGEGMDALIGDVKEFTAKHPIIAEAAKVATVPVRGIAGALGMVMAPGEKHTGYSLLNEGARAVNETETALISTAIEATANRIGIQGKGAKTLGKLGTLIYSAADSALESAVAMGTGGHLGEVMLGLSAATDAYNEALDNGLPTGRAITTGVVAGVFETLFEHLSLENLRGLSVDTSNVGSFIGKKGFINFLKSAFTEGSEEFFTDIANEAYDYLVNGGYSNFQRTVRDLMAEGMSEEKARKQYARDFGLQLAQDFFVGAMSGGMGFGSRAAVVNARVGTETSNIGRAVRQMGKETEGGVQGVLKTLGSKETEGLTDKSGSYKVGRATLQAFDDYEKRFRRTVKTTVEQAGTENTVKQIDGMLQEAGLHESEAGKVAQAYVDFMTQDKVAYSTLRTIATNDAAVEYINNQLSGDNYSAARELRNKILETASEGRINQKIKKKLEKWVHADEFKRAEAQGEVLKKSADAVQTGETAQLITESVKASTADGQVQVKGIAGIEDGKIKVTVDESGATDDLDNITFDETKDGIKGKQIYTAVADMMRGTGDYNVKMSATAANLVIALAQNTDTPVEVFLQDAYEAYKAGTVMRSRDTVEVETDYAISNKEIEAMYAAGAAEYKVQKGVTRIGTQKMTEAQTNMLQVLDRFFQTHELSLIVVDNLWERTRLKDYRLLGANYTDTQGTDVIVIALNAGKNQENVLDLTAYHELFHWLKKQGPDGRQAAQEMIDGINEGAKAKDADGYREMVDELEEVGYTADEIAEEIACQYMGTLMSAESFRQQTANDEEAAAAWGDSLPHLKDFYDGVRGYIKQTFGYDKRVQTALEEDVDTAAGWVARFEGTLSYVQAQGGAGNGGETKFSVAMTKEAEEKVIRDSADVIKKSLAFAESGAHEKLIDEAWTDAATLPKSTATERYRKIIDIWKKIGGNINSEFLNAWDKKVGKDRAFEIFKAQSGYKYNAELASMCKKGIALFDAIDVIVKERVIEELGIEKLGKHEKEILYDILKNHGHEIPCAICYVEQARQREGTIIRDFVDGNKAKKKLGWNEALDKIEERMQAQGITYKFGKIDIAAADYTPADAVMSEKEQNAFYNAVFELVNEEIENANKTAKKKRTAAKAATPQAINAALKGSITLNMRVYKSLVNELQSRYRLPANALYSSVATQNIAKANHELYKTFNMQGGVSGYKTKQTPIVYWGDILKMTDKPAAVRKAGGIRWQSNSDFQMYTFLDRVQYFLDMTAKGYYHQEYTKVPASLKLFGLMRGKQNASLIPAVHIFRNADGSINEELTRENAGLDEDGEPIYDKVEGIDPDEAFMIAMDREYSKSVGTICVGYSDNHIWKLLDDERVSMIIGFHDKTDNPEKRYRGARYAHNYNGENEAKNAKGETVHVDFSSYIIKAENKFKKTGEAFTGTTTFNGKTYTADDIPKLAADIYLSEIKAKGWTPAYEKFAGHENYYKLLADFRLVDAEGHYAPHRPVQFFIPDTVPVRTVDGNGNVRVEQMDTEEYIQTELEKEMRERDAIARDLADTSEDGIIPQFKKAIREDGTSYSYAGVGSETADHDMLEKAIQMEKEGEDAETIWRQTGWGRGLDGKWRYEIDNSELKINADGVAKATNYHTTLDRILEHPKLYEAYPALRNINVYIEPKETIIIKRSVFGIAGMVQDGDIVINLDIVDAENDYKELKSVLLHEIQHLIQTKEGFASGASKGTWQSLEEHREYENSAFVDRVLRFRRWNRYGEEMYDLMNHASQNYFIFNYSRNGELYSEEEIEQAKREYEKEVKEILKTVPARKFAEYRDAWFGSEVTYNIPHIYDTGYAYQNTAGEIEARDVQRRYENPELKRNTGPSSDTRGVMFTSDYRGDLSEKYSNGYETLYLGDAVVADYSRALEDKRDAGEKLTENEFYRLYSAHKLNLRRNGDVAQQIENIRSEGFKGTGGFGHNLMPSRLSYLYPTVSKYNVLKDLEEHGYMPKGSAEEYKQEQGSEYGKAVPANISVQKYAPRKGEYILLVPKSGTEINKYYDRVKPGYKPKYDYEIVQADYDYQPYYEMYSKAYDKKNYSRALDDEYMAAVENGDEETQARLVEQAARNAGYNTPRLFHGTSRFGFTVFREDGQQNAIYLTDSAANASTYSLGALNARPLSTANIGKDLSKYTDEQILDFVKMIMPYYQSYELEGYENLAWMDVLPAEIKEQTKNEYGYRVKDGEYETASRDLAEQIIRGYQNRGIYALYGKMEKPYVYDCQYADWNMIKAPEDLGMQGETSVNKIAEQAFKKGYDSVVLENVIDIGEGMNAADYMDSREPSTTYVFKNANQVKSADPVTYDDDGNVIPLSERFNSANNDIRYSRVLNQNALEYVERLKSGSRQLWEMIDILEDRANTVADLRETMGAQPLDMAALRRIARRYNHSFDHSKAYVEALAMRLAKAQDMLATGANVDTVLYGLYKIAEKEWQDTGHWEVVNEDAQEFIDYLRPDGKMPVIFMDESTYSSVAAHFGGRKAFRDRIAGKFVVTTDAKRGGTALDDFYSAARDQNKFPLPETTEPSDQMRNMIELYESGRETQLVDTAEDRDLVGETLAERATDDAFNMLRDLLYPEKMGRDQQLKAEAARLDELQAYVQTERRRGIQSTITKADEELQKRLEELSRSGKTTVEIEIERDRLKQEYRMEALRRAYAQRIESVREYYKEQAQKEAMRRDIKRNLTALINLFNKESDSQHVPEVLKKTVLEFLAMFDKDRSLITAVNMHRIAEFADEIKDVGEDEIPQEYAQLFGRFDEDIRADINELIKKIEKIETDQGIRVHSSMLSLDDMRVLNNTAEHIRFLVESANEAFVDGKRKKISAIAENIIAKAKSVTQSAVGKMVKNSPVYDFIATKMLTPINFFDEKIGGAMADVYEGFRNGQDEWFRRVAEGKNVLDKAKDKYHYKDWKDKTIHFSFPATLDRSAWEVDMPIEAVLQIYATLERERRSGKDTAHLTSGGVVLGDELTAGKGIIEKLKGLTEKGAKAKIAQAAEQAEQQANANRHQLSWEELLQITQHKEFTKEMKDYADTIVKYMSTDVSRYGNEATMALSGIRKFNEEYYFPFQSAKNYLYTRLGVSDDTRLKNAGFTKRVKYGANTPLVLSGFTSVAANHIQQMALFSTMTVPIDTLQRVINYQQTAIDENGNVTKAEGNVKTAISNAYGKSAMSYINTFVTQVNGGIRTDPLDSLWNKGTSMFKRAAVMGNLSVVVQQPTAMMRGMAILDPKYIFGKASVADYREMLEHAPIAGIKEQGGFDTGTGRGAVAWMLDEAKPGQRITELWGKPAAIADAVAWTNLWNGCKRETRDKHPELEYGSDAFYDAVYKRFRDIVDYTQVYDSTLSKNELMRGAGGLTKMVTAFMAEPSLSLNMLMMSGKGRKINKSRALAAFAANIIVNSMFKAIVAGWRDKDDDESYSEKWLEHFISDLVGDKNVLFLDGAWSPFGMIPWVKDILSLWQGYNVDRSDISAISDLIESAQGVGTAFDKFDGTWESIDLEAIADFAGSISAIGPMPMEKAIQDVMGITRVIFNKTVKPFEISWETARQTALEGMGFTTANAEKAYDAAIRNNTEYIRRQLEPDSEKIEQYIATGNTPSEARTNAMADAQQKWETAVKNGILAKDERAVQAADALWELNLSAYEMLVDDMVDDGLPRNSVLKAIKSLYDALKPEEAETKSITDKPLYSTDNLTRALENNDLKAWNRIKEVLLIQETSEDTITKKATDYAKALLADGDEKSAKQVLTTFAGMSDATAAAKVKNWKNPDGLSADAWYKYYDEVASSGISADVFERFWTADSAAKGEDKNGDGKADNGTKKAEQLKIIDSLPITSEQKDVLYRLHSSWGESKLSEAPWH